MVLEGWGLNIFVLMFLYMHVYAMRNIKAFFCMAVREVRGSDSDIQLKLHRVVTLIYQMV